MRVRVLLGMLALVVILFHFHHPRRRWPFIINQFSHQNLILLLRRCSMHLYLGQILLPPITTTHLVSLRFFSLRSSDTIVCTLFSQVLPLAICHTINILPFFLVRNFQSSVYFPCSIYLALGSIHTRSYIHIYIHPYISNSLADCNILHPLVY